MILTEVALHNIRGFKQLLRFKLGPGLNLIEGKNGSGKSTIIDSLFILLAPSSKNADMAQGQAGIIIKTADRQTHRLVRDFSKGKSSLARRTEEGKFKPLHLEEDQIHQFILENTGGIKHTDLLALYALGRSSMPSARFSIPSPGGSVTAPKSRISSDLASSEASITESDRKKKQDRIDEISLVIKQADRIGVLEEQLSDLKNESADLKQNIRFYQEKTKALLDMREKDIELDAVWPLPADQLRLLESYDEKKDILADQIETLEEDKSKLEKLLDSVSAYPIYLSLPFLSGAGILVASFVLPEFIHIEGFDSRIFFIPIFFGIGLITLAVLNDFRGLIKRKTLNGRIKALSGQQRRIEEDYQKSTAPIQELLDKLKCTTIEEFRNKSSQYEQRLRLKRDLMDERDRALEGRLPENLEDDLLKATENIAKLEEEIRQLSKTTTNLPLLEDELIHLQDELAKPEGGPSPSRAESRETLPLLKPEHGPDTIIAEPVRSILLGDPYQDELRTNLERINQTIMGWLKRFPQCRLVDVRMMEDFTISLARKDGTPLVETTMNSSLLDQIFFVVFLSLSTFFSGFRPFPIILDDPLISLDRANYEIAVDLLREIAQNRQILLLTTRSHQTKEGDGMVSLPMPII